MINPVGQYRTSSPGILGNHGSRGNLESASYIISKRGQSSKPTSRPNQPPEHLPIVPGSSLRALIPALRQDFSLH
jgi:hypothetical protein